MRWAAVIVVFVALFPLALLYCFKRRRVSERPGSFHLLVIGLACASALLALAAVEGPRRLRRATGGSEAGTGDLLQTLAGDPSGARIVASGRPDLALPAEQDAAAWETWLARLRGYLTEQVYELDLSTPAGPSPAEWLRRETSTPGLIRREYAIPAADGDTIPAVLLLPESAGRVPGVLLLPGHVDEGKSGLAQMVLPMRSFHRSAARELAQAGLATLTIELRGFGLRGPPRFPEHRVVAYNALLGGSFYKRIALQDIRRAFEFFRSLPEVDPDRLGLSGVSLGGELAVDYAGLDTRVKATSFHSHGGRVGPYSGYADPEARQPHYCHLIPGSSGVLRHEDPFLLLAPRPTQGVRGEEQPFRQAEFGETLRQLWALLDSPQALELETVPGPTTNQGHAYFVEQAAAFFKKHL